MSISNNVIEDIQPEEIKPVEVEDDPNMVKVPQMQFTKMNLKINELETKIGGYEMTMGVLQKEKEASESNNADLKNMISDLQAKLQEANSGEVRVIRDKVFPL